jgi:hypothetical protein
MGRLIGRIFVVQMTLLAPQAAALTAVEKPGGRPVVAGAYDSVIADKHRTDGAAQQLALLRTATASDM